MPQLNLTIYFHEYAWLFFTFFLFYFVFLKYYLPTILYWMKVKHNNLVYHLTFITSLDNQIKQTATNQSLQQLYKLLLSSSLIGSLGEVYRKNLKNQLKSSNVERTIFTLLLFYKK